MSWFLWGVEGSIARNTPSRIFRGRMAIVAKWYVE